MCDTFANIALTYENVLFLLPEKLQIKGVVRNDACIWNVEASVPVEVPV